MSLTKPTRPTCPRPDPATQSSHSAPTHPTSTSEYGPRRYSEVLSSQCVTSHTCKQPAFTRSTRYTRPSSICKTSDEQRASARARSHKQPASTRSTRNLQTKPTLLLPLLHVRRDTSSTLLHILISKLMR
ncbi:hypothetical protein DPMN_008245 [Dreissena polymorpha]|uniref:Uncharacterized protein n=1 Tax=Dreissena polymorpha TaxID=45954 RepID=A0A9D4RZG3_DREPO|nr:hypothetical protein DPMN_008245 [Dreissena polymorpha]